MGREDRIPPGRYEEAEVGSTHPCRWASSERSLLSAWEERFGSALGRGWCCAWIQEVQKKAAEGNIICCAVSNIYDDEAWLSPCQVVSIFFTASQVA